MQMKTFAALCFALALAVGCSKSLPTEPPPVETPVPAATATPTPTPGCSFTGIQNINGTCYRCVNGTIGTVACPTSPTVTPTAAPTATPSPAPAQCSEGQSWAVAGPNGPICYFCHFGEAIVEPCGPVVTPTPAGCVSPCQ